MVYFKSLMTENPMAKEAEIEAHKNQFHSTERGTQTKMFKYNDESLQTDPLPVYRYNSKCSIIRFPESLFQI